MEFSFPPLSRLQNNKNAKNRRAEKLNQCEELPCTEPRATRLQRTRSPAKFKHLFLRLLQ